MLIKEIGTDALCGLMRVASQVDAKHGTGYAARVSAFYQHCRDNDLAMAVAQTDVKGDRSLGPAAQADPDLYVHIVERRADGIVVRGAKAHTSVSTNANELIVLPTRAMAEADRDYAVSFAVPVDTPGLVLLASAYDSAALRRLGDRASDQRRHKMMETTTVFDDVFVPWERVFLAGESEFAGPLALAFVEHHRFTAISYKLPLVDALVGSAMLMAELNGIAKAGHVRDKLVHLISYAETLRGLTQLRGDERQASAKPASRSPDPLYVNMAKYHFAHGYHEAVRDVQDIAGGALVTGPGAEDLENEETARYYDKYYAGQGDRRSGAAEGARRSSRTWWPRNSRVSGGAGRPRRRVDRGREADGAPQLRRLAGRSPTSNAWPGSPPRRRRPPRADGSRERHHGSWSPREVCGRRRGQSRHWQGDCRAAGGRGRQRSRSAPGTKPACERQKPSSAGLVFRCSPARAMPGRPSPSRTSSMRRRTPWATSTSS